MSGIIFEPFAGSLAVLLSRPHPPGIETINDLDGMVCNFWRALAEAPEEVARHADWPVSELDLHARHQWLVTTGLPIVEQLRDDPAFFDAKIAGWWVWGCCQWIGSGWCRAPTSQKRPHLGHAGMGIQRTTVADLSTYFAALSVRLRQVRICCGDWSRVCGPTPTVLHGLTAVFFDPPYAHGERTAGLYAVDTDVSAAVRTWCLTHGTHPLLRICLAGYEGEGHEVLLAHGWRHKAWKTQGGYGLQGTQTRGRANAARERLYFSPHCLTDTQLTLF
jgi:DNA adenine methylase